MHSWFLFGLGIGIFALSCVFPLLATKFKNRFVIGYLAVTDGVLTFISLTLCCVGIGTTWGLFIVIIGFLYISHVYTQIMGPDYRPYGIARKRKTKNKNLDQRLVSLNETIQARLEQYPPGKYDDPALWKLLKDMDGIIKEWS